MQSTLVSNPEYPHRVIDTHKFEFESNTSLYKENYAILSHTWIYTDGRAVEVSYIDAGKAFSKWKKQQTIDGSDPGTAKLINAVNKARETGYKYLWMDTCCIDKSNKEEETIAILSMGVWYSNATVCFVFLNDLATERGQISSLVPREVVLKKAGMGPPLRWATRSWTLQEIILSRSAVFFNKFWNAVFETNTDSDRTELTAESSFRAKLLYTLCSMPAQLVCCRGMNVSAREIIKLATSRDATMPEDRIYSLMGVLGVRMEPMYKEGILSALERLCVIVAAKTNDKDIHTWARSKLLRKLQAKAEQESAAEVYPIDKIEFPRGKDVTGLYEELNCSGRGLYKGTCRLHWDVPRAHWDCDVNIPLELLYNRIGGKSEWAMVRWRLGVFVSKWILCELIHEKLVVPGKNGEQSRYPTVTFGFIMQEIKFMDQLDIQVRVMDQFDIRQDRVRVMGIIWPDFLSTSNPIQDMITPGGNGSLAQLIGPMGVWGMGIGIDG